MPYEFNWKNNGYIVTLTGISSIEEIHEANGKLQGDYRFDEHKFHIWNQLEADLSSVDISKASEPASIDSVAAKYIPGIKVAFIVQEANAVALCMNYIRKSKDFNSTWETR